MSQPAFASGFRGRVALVTGASRGIGSALARALAGAGADVALGYREHGAAAEALAAELRAAGGRAVALAGDLAQPETPARLVEATAAALGPIDILCANAGHMPVRALDQVTLRDFDATVAVNLRAPFFLAQAVAPGMKGRGFGRILFVSSVAAFTGGLVGPHYAASKAGLHGMLHYLARHLAPHGVTVNAIAPALIEDAGNVRELAATDRLRAGIPVGRLGRSVEVAELALAVLGNGYLTNQVISLDGGMHPR
jgi:3-oxoacyl-[acyl-carrier protein] reductase